MHLNFELAKDKYPPTKVTVRYILDFTNLNPFTPKFH